MVAGLVVANYLVGDIITSYFTNPAVILATIPKIPAKIINCIDPAQITAAETALKTAETAVTSYRDAMVIAQSNFEKYTSIHDSAGGIDFGGPFLGMTEDGENLYKTLENLQETKNVLFFNLWEAGQTLYKLQEAACRSDGS